MGITDKELADKVVALGVGHFGENPGEYYLNRSRIGLYDSFVRDWRVAGALMEKCQEIVCGNYNEFYARCNIYDQDGEKEYEYPDRISNDSLPRAIIEACVEALT